MSNVVSLDQYRRARAQRAALRAASLAFAAQFDRLMLDFLIASLRAAWLERE